MLPNHIHHHVRNSMGWIRLELDRIKDRGLYRNLKQRPICNGQRYDFASNDYLGLSQHPEVIKASCLAIKQWGSSGMSSRLVYGNSALHEDFEHELADFLDYESALVFSSGYLANLAIITTFCGKNTRIYSDSSSHASLIDGMRLSKATISIFSRGNSVELEKMLLHDSQLYLEELQTDTGPYAQRCIITDSIYSTDGNIAPIADLYALAQQYDALLIIDEAHAIGVYGTSGRGVVHEMGLSSQPGLIVTGTLSKSLASQGGFILCDNLIREYLINSARQFIFDTAVLPAALGAASAALELLIANPNWPQKISDHAYYLRDNLSRRGITVLPAHTASAIVCVPILDPDQAYSAYEYCLAQGVFVGCFRPPSVPVDGSRLRIALKAHHCKEELDYLITTIVKAVS